MGDALATIIRREIDYPEYTYIFDATDAVLKNSLLVFPSKKVCMQQSKRLYKKAQRLLDSQFSAASSLGLWKEQSEYIARTYLDYFETVLPAVKDYCKAASKEAEYIAFSAKLKSAKSRLETSFKNELVKNASFYGRQTAPVGKYFKDNVTYTVQPIPSDRSTVSKLIRRLFKQEEVLWTPEGLVIALEELRRTYDYRLRRYFRETEYFQYKLAQEIVNSFVQSFEDPSTPYSAKYTIAQYFEMLTDRAKQKKSA